MDKKQPKTTPKTSSIRTYPRKYSKDVVENVTSLIKEGKTLKEILGLVEPRKKAVLRICRKYNLTLKK